MDIVKVLDQMADVCDWGMLSRASDAIALEREISEKLHRALVIAFRSNSLPIAEERIVIEAIESYWMTRENFV